RRRTRRRAEAGRSDAAGAGGDDRGRTQRRPGRLRRPGWLLPSRPGQGRCGDAPVGHLQRSPCVAQPMSAAVPAPRLGPGPQRVVLADVLVRSHGLATQIALALAAAALVALAARVTVPLWPVPVTGQTLGVLVVGAALGARRAAAAMTTYLLA